MCVCNVYDIYIYITADTCVNDILITDEYVDNNKALIKNFSPSFLKHFKEICLDQLKFYNNMESYNEKKNYIMSFWKNCHSWYFPKDFSREGIKKLYSFNFTIKKFNHTSSS